MCSPDQWHPFRTTDLTLTMRPGIFFTHCWLRVLPSRHEMLFPIASMTSLPDPETGLPLVLSARSIQGKPIKASSTCWRLFRFLPGILACLVPGKRHLYLRRRVWFFCPNNANTPCTAGQVHQMRCFDDANPDVQMDYNLVGMYERDGLTLRVASTTKRFPKQPR